jgi:hypothetical protein
MTTKRRTVAALLISLVCLSSFPCLADEILFQDQKGVQTGVVVGEDDQSVTIRFPRDAIKSITRSEKGPSTPLTGKVIWEEGKDYLILKIPRRSIRVVSQETRAGTAAEEQEPSLSGLSRGNENAVQSEGPSEATGKNGSEQTSGSSKNKDTLQKLLREETGSVEGVILWQGKPLQNREVKIVLERYIGFSLAALKEWFSADKNKSSQGEIVLETRTDSHGRYIFHETPPGYYRLYWIPDEKTGWVHRLREKPDIEVTTGNLTVEDVPEKKK